MKKAIYAGTFDPFTNGHNDILCRSLALFDEVIILIAVSPSKSPLFTIEERVEMIGRHFAQNDRVKVDSWNGLIVDYAKKHKIAHLVRGLRPTGDFEIEFQMAAMNSALLEGFETLFLPTGGDYYFVSSSLVKEVIRHKGDIRLFVPKIIAEYVKK